MKLFPYNTEEDLLDILKSFVIDVRIIGDDYRIQTLLEKITVNKKE